MANVEYGSIIVSMNGHVRGFIFQDSNGYKIARYKPIPRNPQTMTQQATRASIEYCSRMWKICGYPNYAAWQAYGEPLGIAAYPAYMKVNVPIVREGGELICFPTTPSMPTVGEIIINFLDPGHLTTILAGANAATTNIEIFWGDGTSTTATPTGYTTLTHNYATPGTYTITYTSDYTGNQFRIECSGTQGVIDCTYLSENVWFVFFQFNNLSVTAVNNILIMLDNGGNSPGQVSTFSQTPPAPPTTPGITAMNNLISKGWTVATD